MQEKLEKVPELSEKIWLKKIEDSLMMTFIHFFMGNR